jgi:two-component system NarL family response regulator
MHTISLLIADDHPLILAGLAAMLTSMPEFRLLGQACNGREALAGYQDLRPDVVLMDLNMPKMNGVDAILRIRQLDPQARIIILTTYQGEEDVYRGLHAGACGYLLKDCGIEHLANGIRTVAAGRRYLPDDIAATLAGRMEANRLSRRELDILRHLVAGMSNKMIARSAGIGVGTVKFHVNNILSKLNATSRTEAATVATRRGLLNLY